MKFNEKSFWDRRIKKFGMKSTGARSSNLYEYSDKLKWRIFQDQITLGRKKRILDVGCGYGRWSVKLAKLGHIVFGTDVSSESINNAKKYAKKNKAKVEFAAMPAQKLKVKKKDQGKFDLALSITVLQHVVNNKDWEEAFRRINKILKKNGLLFLIESASNKKIKQKLEYKAERTLNEHKKVAKKTGFEVIEVRGTMIIGYKLFYLTEIILPNFLKFVQKPMMYFVGHLDYILSKITFMSKFTDHKMILMRKCKK